MQQNLTVPCNVEAEIALLGCVLIDENLMVEPVSYTHLTLPTTP